MNSKRNGEISSPLTSLLLKEQIKRMYLIKELNVETGETKEIYEEKDDTYILNVQKTGDFQYIFIGYYDWISWLEMIMFHQEIAIQ